MSYIDDNLMPEEQVIYRTQLHWVVFIRPAIFLIIAILIFTMGDPQSAIAGLLATLALFFLLAAIIDGVGAFIKLKTSEFGLTNKRVIAKAGWIRRRSLETLLQKVEGISVDQGLFGRIFNYGTVVITGTGGSREPFRRVATPLELRKRVHQQIGEAK